MKHRSPLCSFALLLGLILGGHVFAAEAPPSLLKLAEARFQNRAFTAAEKALFAAAETGEVAAMAKENDPEADPARHASWPADRTLHADVLYWLCTDPIASARITHRGLRLRGMRVEGDLDLTYAKIGFPFTAESCVFTDPIDLTDAQTRAVVFACCFLRGLDASRAHIQGDLTLGDGCRVAGALLFYDAIIDGALNCEGAELRQGLGAGRVKVGSSVYFRNGFRSEGEVMFGGATIGGDLDCQNSSFINPESSALIVAGAKVARAVAFRGSVAEGHVNFAGTEIGSDLDCDGSIFNNPGGRALDLDGGKVGGQVFLRYNFVAFGQVSVTGATIKGNLEVSGAQIYNPGKVALLGDRVTIGDGLFLRPDEDGFPFTATGEVGLLGATIDGSLECDSARITNPGKTNALMAERAKIGGNVFLRRKFKPDGTVNFISAEIARSLFWLEVEVTPNTNITLANAKVGSLFTDATMLPQSGIIEVDGQAYDRLVIDGLVYDRIFDVPGLSRLDRIEWLRMQSLSAFRPQPYQQLAAVFRAMGSDREAKEVMIAKNSRRSYFTTPLTGPWVWYNVVGPLIGYGYKPGYAFLASLGLILLGGCLFRAGYHAGVIIPSKPGAYVSYGGTPDPIGSNRERFSHDYPKFNAFVYSLEAFTPLLRLDQSANWAPNAHRGKFGRLLRMYLWCHIILGWILTSLWVTSVTGLVKT